MVREAHPRLVLVENVQRLLGLHFERLLRDLADEGYDCEWDVISAAAVGGPHLRERLWILAYPAGEGVAPRAFGRPLRRSKLDPWTADKAKWPRAGMMCQGVVFESEPVAPRKTKRVDGRTYWVGVNLLEQPGEQVLIPSPRQTDGDRGGRGDLVQAVRGNSNGHFAQRIWDGQIIPTPTVQDARNHGGPSQSERHYAALNVVASQGLWPTVHGMPRDGAERVQGPSGNELGRAVNQGLWPTPKADSRASRADAFESYENGRHGITLAAAVDGAARGLFPTPTVGDSRQSRNATAGRSEGQNHHSGTTLSDLAFDGSLEIMPTPMHGSNRRSQKAMLASVDNGRRSGGGNSSPPGLEQVVEIMDGVVPRELEGVAVEHLPPRTREMLAARSLLPTPAATSYGSNQGGAAGRVGDVRHSLESLARNGLLPSTQSGLSEPRSLPSSTSVSATSSASLRPCEPSATDGDLLVPRFSFHDARGDGHTGTSPKRAGGENLRTSVASVERGSLNPDWVEWMMALPVGWTDVDCVEPVYRPFWDEPTPRVIKECPNRRARLSAIGNSLVWLVPFYILSTYRDRVGSLPGDVGRPRLSAFS